MLIKLAAVAAAIHSLGQLGTDIYINFYTFVGGEIYSYGVGARSDSDCCDYSRHHVAIAAVSRPETGV